MSRDERKKKPDVLDDLFQRDDQGSDPKLDELLDLLANLGEAFPGPHSGTPQHQAGRKKTRKRSSSYLSEENFQTLDQAKAECRRLLLKKDKKGNISKSRITEIALEIIFKDFEVNKEKSLLAQKLQKDVLKKK